MTNLGIIILAIQAILFLAAFVAIVYLIARRIDKKKKETFEKRDN